MLGLPMTGVEYRCGSHDQQGCTDADVSLWLSAQSAVPESEFVALRLAASQTQWFRDYARVYHPRSQTHNLELKLLRRSLSDAR